MRGRTLRDGRRHPEAGMALVLAMFFVAIAVVVLAALTSRLVGEGRGVFHFKSYESCALGLDSATSQALASLETLGNGMIGVDPAAAPVGTGLSDVPTFANKGVTGQVLSELPTLKYMAYTRNWGSDSLDNNGNGTIDEAAEKQYYAIYATAQDGATTRKTETIVKSVDIRLWENALTIGNGLLKQGALIGNAYINGGVLILGPNLAPSDPAISLSSGAYIANGYQSLSADLLSRIPSLPTTSLGLGTLNANVRIKNGTATVTSPAIVGGSLTKLIKDTVDGSYVNGGWVGADNVKSDNGATETYDLRDRVTMPQLDISDYYDPKSGTIAGTTHADYFKKLSGTPYPGNMTITYGTGFYYNASRPSDTDPSRRLDTDNYIYYKSAGLVDLSFANGAAICAYGTGKIRLGGNTTINGNIQLAAGSSGFLDMNNNSHVTGAVIKDDKGVFTPDKTSTVDGGIKIADLSGAALAAEKAIATITALTVTQKFGTINTNYTIKSTGAVNVIQIIGDLNLAGNEVLTLDGAANDVFIIRVTGKIVTSGNASIQSTQNQSSKILFNSLDTMSLNGKASIGTFISSGSMDIGNQNYNSNFIFGFGNFSTAGKGSAGGQIFDGGGGSGNLLEVNGMVDITGNLSIAADKAGSRNLTYTGRGAILAHGDVSIDTNLLAVNKDGSVLKSFPEANCLGIMALKDMRLATNADITVMAPLYAEGQISMTYGVTAVSGFMANSVAAGKVFPSIFAVPTLPDNLPQGMIGAASTRVMKPISYREIPPV